jgi:hypothetical protein
LTVFVSYVRVRTMTRDEAIELVKQWRPRDFIPPIKEVEHIFRALFGRDCNPDERDQGLWDLCVEETRLKPFYTEAEIQIMTQVAMGLLQKIEVQYAWDTAELFIRTRRAVKAKTKNG